MSITTTGAEWPANCDMMTHAEMVTLQDRMWTLGRFVVTRRGPDAKAVQRDALKAFTEVDRLVLETEAMRMRLVMTARREHEALSWAMRHMKAAEFYAARCHVLEEAVQALMVQLEGEAPETRPRC